MPVGAAPLVDVGSSALAGLWLDPAPTPPAIPAPRAELRPRVAPVEPVEPAADPLDHGNVYPPNGGRSFPRSRQVRRAARRVLEHLLTLLVIGALAVFVLLAVGPRTGRYQTTTMLTGSMAPALPVGAVLVDVPVAVTALHPGDVVTFRAPIPGHPVVSHRLVAVVDSGGRAALRTKGDANSGEDPWLAVPDGGQVWVVKAALPGAGAVVHWLRQPGVHRLTVVGLPLLVACWLLLLIWREEPA